MTRSRTVLKASSGSSVAFLGADRRVEVARPDAHHRLPAKRIHKPRLPLILCSPVAQADIPAYPKGEAIAVMGAYYCMARAHCDPCHVARAKEAADGAHHFRRAQPCTPRHTRFIHNRFRSSRH